MIDSSYVLVQWPESQDYMMEPWFQEEAILALGSEDKTGSSAYFIPMKRYLEVSSFKKNEIQSLVEELSDIYPVEEKDIKYNEDQWNDFLPFEGGMNTHESIVDIAINRKK